MLLLLILPMKNLDSSEIPVKPYFIILKNSETSAFFHRATYWAVTFPEAVREAYRIRVKKGYDWQISSVCLDTQWDLKHNSK